MRTRSMQWGAWFLMVCGCFASQTKAAAPSAIEAYGDSLTAGFLSIHSLEDPPPLSTFRPILSDLARFAITRDHSYKTKYENKSVAWPAYLAEHFGVKPEKVYNHSRAGDRVFDFERQLGEHKGPYQDTAAFFLMGHNDICKNTKNGKDFGDDIVDQYKKHLLDWDSTHKNSIAYILPVANVEQVFELLADETWYKGPKVSYTCMDSWRSLFPYCIRYRPLLDSGKLQTYIRDRVTLINDSLEPMVEKLKSANGNRFQFLDEAKQIKLERKYFAIDCYHLNVEGQKAVAEFVAKRIPKDL